MHGCFVDDVKRSHIPKAGIQRTVKMPNYSIFRAVALCVQRKNTLHAIVCIYMRASIVLFDGANDEKVFMVAMYNILRKAHVMLCAPTGSHTRTHLVSSS